MSPGMMIACALLVPTVAAVLVLCRLCDPSSELHIAEHLYKNSAIADLLGVPAEKVNDDRLYRALDRLLVHKDALQIFLKNRLGSLFDIEYDLLLYDVTSTYFEGRAHGNPKAQRGYSRDHRGDCKQVCIALVVTKADLGLLLRLQFGWGDIFMLAAITCWALYMVLLKRAKLAISPWVVLFVVTLAGVIWLVPAYAAEIASGQGMAWTWRTAASLVYVGLFSTIIAWACWNAGTLRIGPNRASAFMCLHPVFGSALGMIFFGETIRGFHIAGTVLVLIGVVLVSRAYVRKTAEA